MSALADRRSDPIEITVTDALGLVRATFAGDLGPIVALGCSSALASDECLVLEEESKALYEA